MAKSCCDWCAKEMRGAKITVALVILSTLLAFMHLRGRVEKLERQATQQEQRHD